MLSIPFPKQEATVHQLLCLVPGRAAEEAVYSPPASHLSEQRDALLVCLVVCQLIEVTSPLYLASYFLHHCGYHDPPFKQTFSSAAGASRHCSLCNQPWRLRGCVHVHNLLAAGIFLRCFLI